MCDFFPPTVKSNCTPLPYPPCKFRPGITLENPYTEWTKRANIKSNLCRNINNGAAQILRGSWSNQKSHNF